MTTNKSPPDHGQGKHGERGRTAYAIINDILRAGIVVDIDGDAAEGGDFGGEVGEAGVVLSVCLFLER